MSLLCRLLSASPPPMDEPPFYADVDLPFHVWVREGRRWVLRDAAPRVQGELARSPAKEPDRRPRRNRAAR